MSIFLVIQTDGEKDIYHLQYVNVYVIAREESKVPQITLCLLLSILNMIYFLLKLWHSLALKFCPFNNHMLPW